MTPDLDTLRALGVLSPLDAAFARRMGELAGEDRPQVQLACAMASRQVQQGHVCLDLESWLASDPATLVQDEQARAQTALRWPSAESLYPALADSPLVRAPDDPERAHAPLVLDPAGRLYLARYRDHEQRLAQRLRSLAAPLDDAPVSAPAPELLDRLFPGPGPDAQRQAAARALDRRFTVISGGPGTGKTSTVVKLLALLVDAAFAAGQAAPRCLLVAPTGKAAARLSDSIRRSREGLPVDDRVKHAIGDQASTIHRALGPVGGRHTRFRHGPERPLDCDLLLVDEASMVDLALMRRLLDAVPEGARVILLGDRDQLASVEAGAVLGDVCEAALAPDSPLADCLTVLTRSYRYRAESGIAALAQAVRDGDVAGALSALDDPALADAELAEPLERGPSARFDKEVTRGYAALRKSDLDERLRALEQFRVLCAHRRGLQGVDTLNPRIEQRLYRGQLRSGAHYPGRPVLITQNDYGAGLFNGDVGVVHAPAAKGKLFACFPQADGHREVALARLPAHESVYAMSVHKSQGSEFDRVAVVLPSRLSPVLSRELLYTAITRARHSVVLYASREVLAQAVQRRVQRATGLVEAINRGASR